MARTIEFYFDFPSPYAYLAHTQLPSIAAEHNAEIVYHPFLILELMKLVGNRPTTRAGFDAPRLLERASAADMDAKPEAETQ